MARPRHPQRDHVERLLAAGAQPTTVALDLGLDVATVARWRRELETPYVGVKGRVQADSPPVSDTPPVPPPPPPPPVSAPPRGPAEVPPPPPAPPPPVVKAPPEPPPVEALTPAWPTSATPPPDIGDLEDDLEVEVEPAPPSRPRPLLPARPGPSQTSAPRGPGRPPKPREEPDPQVYGLDLGAPVSVPEGAPEWFGDFLQALQASGRAKVALRWAGLTPGEFEAWGTAGGCTRELWRAILRARAAYDLRIQQRMEAASAQGKVSAMRWLLEVDGRQEPSVPLAQPGGEQDRGATALDFVRRMVEQVAASAGSVLERDLNAIGVDGPD